VHSCNPVSTKFVAFLLFATASLTAHGQGALKTIDNPKGGRIVYGQVDGQSTEAGAMGAVLRSLHSQYGDKPQVGKLFQVRGTNSVAAFFSMVNRNQGNMQLAGMIIASKTSDSHVEAALLTDQAARFGSTINPMLSKLFSVWRPNGNASSSQAGGAAGQVAALKLYTLPDRSASVSLPDGWNVLPSSGGGTIMAQGPDGSAVALGYPYLAADTNNPSVRQTMSILQRGGLRNTAYAHALYYPYGGDLGRTFQDLLQMARKNQGQGPVTINISSETPMPVSGALRCAHLHGQIDAQDGKGMREMNTVFCSSPPGPHGNYMNLAYHTAVPLQYADRERGTMEAILASFNVNQAVVQSEANAMAAPAIAAIHEIGRRAAQQATNAHAAEDAHNAAVEKRWDAQDKNNQAFSNYLLDQTVIQDNQLNAHGTVWNQTADAMVKSDPQRYEYVNTPNFWKGIDY
jgi:hypothetical protein